MNRIALLIGKQAWCRRATEPAQQCSRPGEALKTVDFEVLKPAQSTTGAGMLIAISALLCSVPSFAFLTAAH